MNERHVIVAVHGLGGEGSVARVARRQVESFSPEFGVSFVSDSGTDQLDARFPQYLVGSKNFRWMHRFAHIPRELAFAKSVDRKLRKLCVEGYSVDWVLTHSHVVAAMVAQTVHLRLRARLALCVHGDVFDRPSEMYGRQLLALYRWAAKRAYPQCDRVYALSQHGRSLALSAGAAEGALRVLPNAVDALDFGDGISSQRSNKVNSSEAIKLLFVGRLSSEKGLDILLEACSLLAALGQQWTLTVVGDGPARDAALMQAERLSIRDRVDFIGRLPREELGQVYGAHDLVCMPSRSDPYPLVALEAMASGTALIAAPVGGLKDMLEGGSGILVGRNEPEAWAFEVSQLNADRKKLRDLAAKGREKVLAENSWPVVSLKLKRDLLDS